MRYVEFSEILELPSTKKASSASTAVMLLIVSVRLEFLILLEKSLLQHDQAYTLWFYLWIGPVIKVVAQRTVANNEF